MSWATPEATCPLEPMYIQTGMTSTKQPEQMPRMIGHDAKFLEFKQLLFPLT